MLAETNQLLAETTKVAPDQREQYAQLYIQPVQRYEAMAHNFLLARAQMQTEGPAAVVNAAAAQRACKRR
jgi:hypothetical protein